MIKMQEIKNLIEYIKTNMPNTQEHINNRTKLNEALTEYNLVIKKDSEDFAKIFGNTYMTYDSYYIDMYYNLHCASEYNFYYDKPISNDKFGTYYIKKFIVPRNGKSVDNICVKIKYRDNIKNIYEIGNAIKTIKLFIGATCVNEFNDANKYKYSWTDQICENKSLKNSLNSDKNEIIILLPITYSNGLIVFDECKYFEIKIEVEQYDFYFVESTKCLMNFNI